MWCNMQYKRVIPVVLFIIAALLSAWISPAMGVERSVYAQHEALSIQPRGENSIMQVVALQETISLLLMEDEVQLFLPIVKR